MFRQAGVRHLFLLHGTFAGNDALGLFRAVDRLFPEVGDVLRDLGKRTVDQLVGEAGNYTEAYAHALQSGLSSAQQSVEVRRFLWSSENRHLARADAAVRLADALAQLDRQPNDRVMLWGHSHAGNVLALLTNLLAADASTREKFFSIGRSYFRWPRRGAERTLWRRVEETLADPRGPLANLPLDIVTFGTPVRYGWDFGGYRRLMHFIHHSPAIERHPCRAAFPPASSVLISGSSDFIQQIGVAGTDFPPTLLAWNAWTAEQRFERFLSPDLPRTQLWQRLCLGQRVHAEGHTLLVDYGLQEGTPAHHLMGHAVYTRQSWLPFHLRQIARVFYHETAPIDAEEGNSP